MSANWPNHKTQFLVSHDGEFLLDMIPGEFLNFVRSVEADQNEFPPKRTLGQPTALKSAQAPRCSLDDL